MRAWWEKGKKILKRMNLMTRFEKLMQRGQFKRFTVLPQTTPGKAAVVCLVVFYLLISLTGIFFDDPDPLEGGGGMQALVSNTLLLLAVTVMATGVGMGLYGIFVKKDYAILAAAATIVGIVVLLSHG